MPLSRLPLLGQRAGRVRAFLQQARGRGVACFVRVTLLTGLALVTVAAGPERDGAAGGAIAAAIGGGALDISTAAEGTDGQQLTWASWTEGNPDHWVTRLVLVSHAADRAAIIWGVQRPDGYGAVLRPTLWRWRGHPVLILQYQFGAAYTRMELYAAGPAGQATMLGRVDGALIAVDRRGTRETLRAYDTAALRGPERCFSWNEAAAKLVAVTCRPGGTMGLAP